jgi:MYXO-CTERM domain-containing protein
MPGRSTERVTVRYAVAAAFGLGLALAPTAAAAYCHTSVCPNEKSSTLCNPPKASDCAGGAPLRWVQGCMGFSIQEGGSPKNDLTAAQVGAMVQTALETWTKASCGTGKPSMRVQNLGTVVCNQKTYNKDAPNANIVLFHDDKWPYENSPNTLALTTVTFASKTDANAQAGAIFDTDLEINGTVNLVVDADAVGNAKNVYDLPSILAHEGGHILGLAHSSVGTATMFFSYEQGKTWMRDLDPDDVAAICDTYPPGQDVSACDTTPRHGYSNECPTVVESKGCSCDLGPRRGGPPPEAALALLGLLIAARRARHAPAR